MSDTPFGFGPSDPDDAEGNDPARRNDPPGGEGQSSPFGFGGFGNLPGLGGALSGGIPSDLSAAMPLFTELQKLFSWQGGPVNWDLAKQSAVSQLATGNHQSMTGADRSKIEEAVRLADLWLDPATSLPSGVSTTEAWTRAEWIERTIGVWSQLCDPVAERLVSAMSSMIPKDSPELPMDVSGLLGQMGGMMFGAQVGQALAQLATEVLSSTDVGLPLGPAGTAVLLPQNVAEFSAGLDLPDEEVRLYLALREAAYQRLYAHVPWLKGRLLDTVEAYARGIEIDKSAIESAMEGIDPQNPENLQEIFSSGVFEPQTTEAQKQTLASLETLLALVEGWVDHVVSQAAVDRLPGAVALAETIRRRRASGGPAEQTFATLVGLELRPRRLREAAALWKAVEDKRGAADRDAIWAHPDLLPSSEDLDDPEKFATGSDEQAFSDAFDELLRGETPHEGDSADHGKDESE